MSEATFNVDLKVTMELDGVDPEIVESALLRIFTDAVDEASSDESIPAFEEYSLDTAVNAQDRLPEYGKYLQQRIEGGDIAPDELGAQMASYGLESPSDFIEFMDALDVGPAK